MRTRSFVTLFVTLFLLCLLIASAYAVALTKKETNVPHLAFTTQGQIKETSLLLAIARTKSAWTTGLSGQQSLLPNQGLLFLFDGVGPHGIWMKNMHFAIDVLWLDQFGTVLFIKEDFLPSSYPEIVEPAIFASMVLEVPGGFVKSHQIGIGDTFTFSKKQP